MELTPGTVVRHFRIEARLGGGGMGVVDLAEDLRLKRPVALKFLASPEVGADAVRRLEREAQTAGALDHPNIAAVHEIGEWNSQPFIALTYCPGETLKQGYFFNDPDGRSPWDRGPSFGFRCMKLPSGEVPAAFADPVPFFFRDFSRERPVSDDVWRAYRSLYDYDHGDLSAVLESTDDSPRDWRHETVSVRAAYGNERMTVHVLLPKRAQPPFQALVVYPGINALHQRSSREGVRAMIENADFVIRSGRALVYPIYKATRERQTALTSDFPNTTTLFRDHVIMWSKDLQRTVDYLMSRSDIDGNKIGYLGRSWGGAMGTIMVATEPRLKLAIFNVGGFYFQHARPEVEAINFAPRVKVPSLMLNGKYDFFFPQDTSQRYMFNLIGTPPTDKRWVVYDTSHRLPRDEMVGETLKWLDRYFGPVETR